MDSRTGDKILIEFTEIQCMDFAVLVRGFEAGVQGMHALESCRGHHFIGLADVPHFQMVLSIKIPKDDIIPVKI